MVEGDLIHPIPLLGSVFILFQFGMQEIEQNYRKKKIFCLQTKQQNDTFNIFHLIPFSSNLFYFTVYHQFKHILHTKLTLKQFSHKMIEITSLLFIIIMVQCHKS